MVAPWINAVDTAFPDSPYAQTAVEYATYVLYRLTAEKFSGIQRTTETYIAEAHSSTFDGDLRSPESTEITKRVGIPPSIQYPQRLYLRGTPANEVFSVHYGETLLDPSEYILFNKRFLKLSNGATWNYACDQRGITVDYSYGMLPPQAGILAATTLANELLILMGEGSDMNHCRIPERVRSVSREGISFDMIDPQEFMDDGRTGIWEIDLFIRTANPSRAKKQPRLLSASDPRRYRR